MTTKIVIDQTFEKSLKKMVDLLNRGVINNSYVARAMYPDIQSPSACGKFKNKLDGNGHFRFSDDEKIKLYSIFKKEFGSIF